MKTWFKAVLLAPLLAYSVSLYGDDKPAPKPAAKPAAKAPAAKAPTAAAPGRAATPAAAPGRAAAPAAAPGRAAAPAAAPGRAGAPASAAGRPVTPGTRPVALRGGGEARVDARGRVTDLHRGGMDIHRGPDGRRDVRLEREDHSRVVVGRG